MSTVLTTGQFFFSPPLFFEGIKKDKESFQPSIEPRKLLFPAIKHGVLLCSRPKQSPLSRCCIYQAGTVRSEPVICRTECADYADLHAETVPLLGATCMPINA
jgi:hypothetical protein